jgi:hypothetical protein
MADRRGTIVPYLELVRVHLTPLAVADSFAGFCLATRIAGALGGRPPGAGNLLRIAASSVLLYWMGMATNDLFDRKKDRIGQPLRPLARGAISPRAAWGFSLLLGLGGLLLALSVSPDAGMAAAALAVLALLYNAGGKRIPVVGNLLMGSCRSINLILGALGVLAAGSLSGLPDARGILVAAAFPGLYIALVTAVSVLEDSPPRPTPFLCATLPILLVPAFLAFQGGFRMGPLLNSLALAMLLGRSIVRGGFDAARTPGGDNPSSAPGDAEAARELAAPGGAASPPASPGPLHPAESFVRAGLSGLFLVDAGLLHASGLAGPAAAEYGLMILAWLWRRRWLQSPA